MLSLIKKSLPNTVRVGGGDFSIYTDFRVWMRFEMEVGRMKRTDHINISYLFKNEMPTSCNIVELFSFSRPESVLPRSTGKSSNNIILDYEIDANLIYSAFMEQYWIDLIDIEELHWHKFLALLNGLSGSTRLREVMGYRSYKKDNRRNIDIYEELRGVWEIHPPVSEEEQAELEEFNAAFGG
ncbi:MAG: Gp15 family bacteriophage protein [Lachnospiraceae bacterium]